MAQIDLNQLLALILQLLSGLTQRPPSTPPVLPPPPKNPTPDPDDDDKAPNPIPPKEGTLPPASGKLEVVWMQLSKDRFPEQYTPQNPFGLLSHQQVRDILEGRSALNYESAVRFDCTFRDRTGNEIVPDEVRELNLAWRSKWVVRNVDTGETSYLVGQGTTYTNNKGKQEAKVQEDGAQQTGVGQGTRNYTDTLGFGQRMDFYREGRFEIYMEVGGVRTNSLTFTVS